MLALSKISYTELNPRQQETYNFQKIAATLADFGFNCMRLTSDWNGADFLADHISGNQTLHVQLKSRLTIKSTYPDDLYIAFPSTDSPIQPRIWYMISHGTLLQLVKTHTQWLETSSWLEKGLYHSANPNKALLTALEKYKIGQITSAL